VRFTSSALLAMALLLGPHLVGAQGVHPVMPPPAKPGPPTQAAPADAPVDVSAIVLRPDQILLLRQALAQAPTQGFAEGEFLPPTLDALLQSSDPAARARGEMALKAAVLRYASAVHRGRLPAGAFDAEWGMRPAPFDAAAAFAQAVSQNKLAAWLNDLPPPYVGYQQLVVGLKTYRDIVARGGWEAIAAGPALKPGQSDARVPALRERLSAEDPVAAKAFADQAAQWQALRAGPPAAASSEPPPSPAPSAPDPQIYDEVLKQAVQTFQRRHGFDGDGVIDKQTVQALNVTAEARVDQIVANMERWRWAPPVLPADRVQVNIAAAIMTLFRADTPVLSMRAVAGRVSDHTPLLQSQIHSIVFNPPWNVPADIAAKELFPKERAHPGYFAKEDFAVIKTATGVRLQQRAGPKSALGQVKFDFDNPYGVYLHDTPSRSGFARESRLVSHGCVRLEKPKELAAQLLQDNPDWTPATIDMTIADGDTQRVQLPHPTAVLIFYWTAFAGPDGVMNFRADPYGWDHELLERIAAGRTSKA
jgi:murein L,D-transpeptidase YcbB/YkuD